MRSPELLQKLERTIEELEAFNEIGKVLTSTLDIHEVLRRIMEKVRELLEPTNWSLLLADPDSDTLVFEIALGPGAAALAGERIGRDEGIAGWVVKEGAPLLVPDVRRDERFSSRFDKATLFTTRSILAVPLRFGGESLGAIELVKGPEDPPFRNEDLRTLATIADYAAIALQNARNFQRVEELTVQDEHTGLYNARYLERVLAAEVLRAKRFDHPLSLIFLDLDHFGRINDAHGHQAGSATLRFVGGILQRTLRSVDIAVRYGGDEFVCVLPETSEGEAVEWAGRLQAALRRDALTLDDGALVKVDASFGVATFPHHAQDPAELLRMADMAMYLVKEGGRGDVATASKLRPGPTARDR